MGKANEQASAGDTGSVGNIFVKGRPGRRPGFGGKNGEFSFGHEVGDACRTPWQKVD